MLEVFLIFESKSEQLRGMVHGTSNEEKRKLKRFNLIEAEHQLS